MKAGKNRKSSQRRRIFERFIRYRPAIVGVVFLLILIVLAVFAPLFSGQDPYHQDYRALLKPPGNGHLLGTDSLGRDVWSRMVYATRISLTVGLVSVSIYAIIGSVLGSLSGYYGGWIDAVIMRATDIVMTFPALIIIITVVALIGPSIYNIMATIGILSWPRICRLVRSQVLSLREKEYVIAAKALGASDISIIFNHLLPNVLGTVFVSATFGIAIAIITEASLSFLGLGVPPPQASWGQMLVEAKKLKVLAGMPWLWIPPGVMISLTVICVNFVGDGLRDAIDPRVDKR